MFIVESGNGGFFLSRPVVASSSWIGFQRGAYVFNSVVELLEAVRLAANESKIGSLSHWVLREVDRIPRPDFELTGKTL